jgi:homocysteine S-methyltransferase
MNMNGRDRARALLLGDASFVTLAGVETFLLYQQGFPLREFCAFEVLDDEPAWATLVERFIRPIAAAAVENGHGVLADSLLWRASPDYVARLGYRPADLARVNREGVARTRAALAAVPALVVAGDIGPRGDGYAVDPGQPITAEAARAYHSAQVAAVAEAGVDVVAAFTMTSPGEAIGITNAAREHGLPIIVSPTVETDGRLPDGSTLGELIERVDQETDGAPLCYMVNCAHPVHLGPALRAAREAGAAWLERLRGVRANASEKSHAELDVATELDRCDVDDLAAQVARLRVDYDLSIVGGCCGTDAEHIAAIARACR